VPLPSTVSYVPPDNARHPDYVPTVPDSQALPKQEPGTRPARALPYEFHVDGEAHHHSGNVTIRFENTGEAGAFFQVRSGDGATGPWAYTVGSHDEASDTYTPGNGSYDYSVYGPNGFLRALKGSFSRDAANLQIRVNYEKEAPGITLEIHNVSSTTLRVSVQSFYNGHVISHKFESGESRTEFWHLRDSFGWYDLTVTVDSDPGFERRFAGHVETGRDSVSDPAIAQ
jgi:phospholipase C